MSSQKLISNEIFRSSIKEAFVKLNPVEMVKNPVMFVTEIGAIISSAVFAEKLLSSHFDSFVLQISLWLWFTVLFANFSEAVAEGRGKAQAETLKKNRSQTLARLLINGVEQLVPAMTLKKGHIVVCEAGDVIPGDGEVVEGIATVDESAITGESAPVVRESGGDRSAVTGGTKVISDKIKVQITTDPGQSFIDRMINLVEGSKRSKTPNEIALGYLINGMTVVFLFAVASLYYFSDFVALQAGTSLSEIITLPVMIALLVCLIPTTIGGLLSAIGISGMDRLLQKNVLAMSGRAVEAAGDIDVLLMDKTGTITLGNRMADRFIPAPGKAEIELATFAHASSLSDETPEGRSIVVLAKDLFSIRGPEFNVKEAEFVPFSASTRMSGVNYQINGLQYKVRKGAVDSIKRYIEDQGGQFSNAIYEAAESVAKRGGTPLAVCVNDQVLGIVSLKDVLKDGIRERFAQLRSMGIRTVMITGDNPTTAAAIAAEAGVDDFMAQATPEDKLERIREEQAQGHLVAMTGDGTNDAPALAQADVGVAMNTGTQAAREAGNMVDLDSNPTKLIDIVETGKQILMTRGSLTTFSLANDVAKYFAIIPALFGSLYATTGAAGPLSKLNLMGLDSPQSAILSAVIFNALIIIVLIPLALKGVKYRSESAQVLLLRNIFIYGFGGVLLPFIGIKFIDLIITSVGLV